MTYEVIPFDESQEYNYLVVLCDFHSPYDHIQDIAHNLSKNKSGNILIDQILHVGNTNKRFVVFKYENGRLQGGRIAFVPKESPYRKASCDFLKNSDVMDGSILSSIQKRLINKGVTIWDSTNIQYFRLEIQE